MIWIAAYVGSLLALLTTIVAGLALLRGSARALVQTFDREDAEDEQRNESGKLESRICCCGEREIDHPASRCAQWHPYDRRHYYHNAGQP